MDTVQDIIPEFDTNCKKLQSNKYWKLTKRQAQILVCMLFCKTISQAAGILGISCKTSSKHFHESKSKIGAESYFELGAVIKEFLQKQ